AAIGDHQIEHPVAVHVGGGDPPGLVADSDVVRRREGAVRLGEEYRDTVGGSVGSDDIVEFVAVEVGNGQAAQAEPGPQWRSGPEAAGAVVVEQIDQAAEIPGDQIRVPVVVQIGDCQRICGTVERCY